MTPHLNQFNQSNLQHLLLLSSSFFHLWSPHCCAVTQPVSFPLPSLCSTGRPPCVRDSNVLITLYSFLLYKNNSYSHKNWTISVMKQVKEWEFFFIPSACWLNNSFFNMIFSIIFCTLVRVRVDPEPIPGSQGLKQKNQGPMHNHIQYFDILSHLGTWLGRWGEPDIWKGPHRSRGNMYGIPTQTVIQAVTQ